MASANITMTAIRPNLEVQWSFGYVGTAANTDPVAASFAHLSGNPMYNTLANIPPFVLDTSLIEGVSNIGADANIAVLWGEELGSGMTNSLSRTQRFFVSNIAEVDGWATDSTTLVDLIVSSKANSANVVDSSGTLHSFIKWQREVYQPSNGIIFVASATVNND
jgi:hypothetical protein